MFFVKERNKSGISIKKTFLSVFPNKVKIHSWTVGPVNLKLLPDQKKFHWRVGGQWPILTLRDQKNDQKTRLTKK